MSYASILERAARVQAEKRAQAKLKPFTRNMAINGWSGSTVKRPTEIDAFDSIRRGQLILSRTYNQDVYFPRKSIAYMLRTLENVHNHTKRCRHCGDEKPKYDFSPDKRNRDGLQAYCKHCRMVIASENRRIA